MAYLCRMTDREKMNQILESIDKLRETQPAAAKFIEDLVIGIKPQIEQLLKQSEEANTKVHTGGE